MKFDCSSRRYEWHRWFAWRPVHIKDGDCRWLETVERKRVVYDFYGEWHYRAVERA